MATTVDSLVVSLGLDPAKFNAGLASAEKQMKSFGVSADKFADKFVSTGAAAGLWGAGIAAAAATAAAAITRAGLDIGASLKAQADQLGMSASAYRAMADNAEEAGLSLTKVERGIVSLNTKLVLAQSDGGKTAAAFAQVGLSLDGMASVDASARVAMVAEAVHNAGTQAEKSAIAVEAFGAQGTRMVAWLDQGAKGLNDAAAGFNAVHGAVNDLSFEKLQKGKNAVGDLADIAQTAMMAFAEGMTPAIVAVRDAVEAFIVKMGGMSAIKDIAVNISLYIAKMGGDMAMGFKIIGYEVEAFVMSFAVGAMKIYRSASALGQQIWNAISEPVKLLSLLWNRVVESINGAASQLLGTFAQIAIATGDESLGKGFQALAANMQDVQLAAEKTANAISFKSVDTSTITATIDMMSQIAAKSYDAAAALEEQARAGNSWGNQAVATIQGVAAEMDKAAADNIDKRTTELDATSTNYAALYDQAVAFYEQIAGLRDANYQSHIDDLNKRQEDAVNNLDFEMQLEEDSAKMKEVQAMELDTRIDQIQADRMKKDRQAGQENLALWRSGYQGKMDVMQSFLGQMSQLMQSNNREMFEVGKAAAISETVINTYKAATGAYSAMASIPFVGPVLGAAAAGAAIVAGLANVQRIQSTQFGSTSGVAGGAGQGVGATAGGGVGVGGATGPSQGGGGGGGGAAPATTINRSYSITLNGDRYTRDQVRGLISAINESVSDGTTLTTSAA